MDLYTSIGAIAVMVVLFLICRYQERKPVGAKPRMIPYRLIMMALIVFILAMAAHVVGILTGTPVLPRNKLYK